MRTVEIRRDRSELRTLIVPGLHGSGPRHWQSLWQAQHPEFERVVQSDWSTPDLLTWARAVSRKLAESSGPAILVAHSFGCLAAVRAALDAGDRIRGALLVAPADPQRLGIVPFVPAAALGFPSIVVASRNDPWMSQERAAQWAQRWHSRLVDAGEAGHINVDAGYGNWPAGERLLAELRPQTAYRRSGNVVSLAA